MKGFFLACGFLFSVFFCFFFSAGCVVLVFVPVLVRVCVLLYVFSRRPTEKRKGRGKKKKRQAGPRASTVFMLLRL